MTNRHVLGGGEPDVVEDVAEAHLVLVAGQEPLTVEVVLGVAGLPLLSARLPVGHEVGRGDEGEGGGPGELLAAV